MKTLRVCVCVFCEIRREFVSIIMQIKGANCGYETLFHVFKFIKDCVWRLLYLQTHQTAEIFTRADMNNRYIECKVRMLLNEKCVNRLHIMSRVGFVTIKMKMLVNLNIYLQERNYRIRSFIL
jgi:hypothetical protein